MATYTQNLDLKKPAQSDKIRIADINNNMDTIDGVVGDIGERSIAAQIGDVEGALAIVSTGNVHGAITSGQYVYIKNHDTLDDGLYVATTNISANGTLSSSNVTADSAGGGLNALNGKFANYTTLLTGGTDTSNNITVPNMSGFSFIIFGVRGTTDDSSWLSSSMIPLKLFQTFNSSSKRLIITNGAITCEFHYVSLTSIRIDNLTASRSLSLYGV